MQTENDRTTATATKLLTAVLALALTTLGGFSSHAVEETSSQVKIAPVQDVMRAFVSYYRPIRIEQSDESKEDLAAQPDYRSESPLYGKLTLATGPDDSVTLVVDEIDTKIPRICVDRNNDDNLTNDRDGEWSRTNDSSSGLSGVVIQVGYGETVIPHTFEFYRY